MYLLRYGSVMDYSNGDGVDAMQEEIAGCICCQEDRHPLDSICRPSLLLHGIQVIPIVVVHEHRIVCAMSAPSSTTPIVVLPMSPMCCILHMRGSYVALSALSCIHIRTPLLHCATLGGELQVAPEPS